MAKTTKPAGSLIATVGLDYRTPSGDVRVEAGEVCEGLPDTAAKWLKAQGLVTTTAEAAKEGDE